MPIGVSEDHEALRQAVAGWAARHCPPSEARDRLDAVAEEPPVWWHALADQGWIGLHVAEKHGGSGYGLTETAVVLEELGRVVAPGPYLPTVAAAAVLAGTPGAAELLLPGIVAGDTAAAVSLEGTLDAEDVGGGLRVSGDLEAVLSGHHARVLVARTDRGWCALVDDELSAEECPSIDRTRRVARVHVRPTVIPPERRLEGLTDDDVRERLAVLAAAEAVGLSQWCVETAAQHARDRVQFGRPIGQFQGVKHRCADMVSRTELARAAVWDASRAAGEDDDGAALAADAAAALAFDAAVDTAKDCVQVLGGIGFTWEHDAHLYLRRALGLRQLLGGGEVWSARVASRALDGRTRRLSVELPAGAESLRTELRAFLAELAPLDDGARRHRLAAAGYVQPQWPAPWGRDASAVEQVVIDEEFRRARIPRPSITIGGWALPPVMVYGTTEQQERWIPPTLRGEITWCQLFSEPGAGSDLASLTTRAERVEGGWRVTGQKVWTSLAQQADWGILLARTDPHAPKHAGISFFMLDMHSPGIEIRPLRELTGAAMFNEVFLDGVFVPDDCLVGEEHDGWRATRTSLANERVFMGSGNTLGPGVKGLLSLLRDRGLDADPLALRDVGEVVAADYALSVLGFRLMLHALAGADPRGSEASVRKLLGVEHDQHVQEIGLLLLGAPAAAAEGETVPWLHQFLMNRALTIAGGTSEVQRNIIGERVLGLPRDA